MLDFSLTDEQEEIRHLAHDVAMRLREEGRVAEQHGAISPALQQTLVQTGLATPFPEQYGGAGLIEAVNAVLVFEELGCGDGGLAIHMLGSMMGPLAIALVGSESQQAQYLPPFCAQREALTARGSLAFAERTGGYSVADMRATAQRTGQHYLVNGTKRDVIHGGASNPRVVLLRLEETREGTGVSAFLLPAVVEGMQLIDDTQKLGLLAAPSASYIFNNARVPGTALLGEPGDKNVLRIAVLYSMLRASVACGTARAAFEYTSRYAQERVAFGRPIVSYQSIAFMIAEIAMKLDAVRLLVWNVATDWDRQVDPALLVRTAEAAQRQALRIAQSATTDAVQIMGGAGFMQDHPVEMWMRNAAAME